MVDGHLDVIRYNRSQHIELVHLMRMNVQVIYQIGQSFSKAPKNLAVDDIWKIPEIDKELSKQRSADQDKWERKAEQALEKYKRFAR